jgi:8-oxo-dGTP pyrophosphatase MutT (NUDIX family)
MIDLLSAVLNLGRRRQVGALPYRRGARGGLEVLLITSRRSRSWLFPKGNLMADRSWPEAAAQEAFEEAGAIGAIETTPLGEYRYCKNTGWGLGRRCVVTLYPLAVERQAEAWPEQGERDQRWVGLDEAAGLIRNPGIRRLLRLFGLRNRP